MLEGLQDYMVLTIVLICLAVGYLIKHHIKRIHNDNIPVIVSVLGVFLASWISGWKMSPDILLQGLISGLGSTGMHRVFIDSLGLGGDDTDGTIKISMENPEFDQYMLIMDEELESIHDKKEITLRVEKIE